MNLSYRPRRSLSILTAAALVVAAAGCGSSSDPRSSAPRDTRAAAAICAPPLPVLSTGSAVAGATVVVSDTGLHCRPRLPAGETLTISLLEPPDMSGHRHRARLATVPVGDIARFRVAIRLPAALRTGLAIIVVNGTALDRRTGCPPNASCARFGSGLRIVS